MVLSEKTFMPLMTMPGTSVPEAIDDTVIVVPLTEAGPWVLGERVVETEAHADAPAGRQVFRFENLQPL
jgi:hypothetical protein